MGATTPRLITDPKEINSVYVFLKSQDLNYPQYDEWCKKAKREIEIGYKKIVAIFAKDNSGNPMVIGEILFQEHKSDSSMLELKNARVLENYRNKKVYTRLLEAVEKYARENNYKKLILDVNIDHDDIISVFHKRGYHIEAKENLYTTKRLDIILTKDISEKKMILSATMSDLEKIIKKLKSIMVSVYRKYFLV